VFEEYFVSQKVPYAKLEPNSQAHVTQAVSYLACLHAIDIRPIRASLCASGFAHYVEDAMRNRLVEEISHARRTFDGLPDVIKLLEEVVQKALKKWKFADDIVLAHGDFQAGNLFISSDRIWPIDWTDFGLCDRAYEVEHFLASVSSSLAESARRQYLAATRTANLDSQRGIVADGIIQAGSHARTNGSADEFTRHVQRAAQAMSSL
jgi:aminoglycoside phosphotransferase (APT) family kinase protein